jgi:hypothetical protein
VQLQTLVSALAYHYILGGHVEHAHIPDTRAVESERRQVMFATAMGLDHFYVRRNTGNAFLHDVLQHTQKTRPSRRYRNHLKVEIADYRVALLKKMRADAPALIAVHDADGVLNDAFERITEPGRSAADRLTQGILAEAGACTPRQLSAAEFNGAAENYYRGTLRDGMMGEALAWFAEDLHALENANDLEAAQRQALRHCAVHPAPSEFLRGVAPGVLRSTLPQRELHKLISLLLISIDYDTQRAQSAVNQSENHENDATPVCGSQHG